MTITAAQLADLTFTSALNDSTDSSFTYTVNDTGIGVTSAVMNITVNAVNDVPVATGNTVIANEDIPLVIGVGDFNFTDAENDALASVTITGLNLNGGTLTHSAGAVTVTNGMTVTAAQLADLTFTSASNDSTDASFTYSVNDAGVGVTSAVMNITVNAVNDAPVLSGANNLSSVDEDPVSNSGTLVSNLIAGQITDADASSLTGIAVVGVDNANGAWEYTINGGSNWLAFGVPDATSARLLAADANTYVRFVPNANWNGTITNGITFHAWDQTSGTNGGIADTVGTIDTMLDNFEVASYSNNDGTQSWTTDWIETDGSGGGASSGDIRVSTPSLRIGANSVGDNIYREADLSAVQSAEFSFLLDNKLSGSGQIEVQVSDNGGTSFTTLATIDNTSVNGTYSYDISAYASSNTQIRFYVTGSSGSHILIDDVQIESSANVGGSTAFSIATASSSITINSVNDTPFGADNTVTTTEDTDYVFTVADFGFSDTADSPTNNLLNVIIATAPANGILYLDANDDGVVDGGETLIASSVVSVADITAGKLKFKAVAEASGTGYDSFTFQVQDDGGVANSGVDIDQTANTITIDVTAVNDAPTVIGENYTVVEGVPYTSSLGVDDLLLNDTDVDGDTLSVNITPVSGPANGALTLNADGTFTYTGNNNFNGTDSFVYEVQDGNGGTAQATVNITVQQREIRILFTTESDVNSSKVPGISNWDSGEILAIGDPNLSFEPVGSDGSILPYFDLEGFSASNNMTVNGLHFVSNDITVGSANSVDLKRGDILFVAESDDVMTSTNSLAITAGDVIIFRPDVVGDLSSGTFIHLLDQPGTAKTTGISLIEKDVLVGDVTLQAGTFIFTQEGVTEENSIYHFSAVDVGAGTTTGVVSTLIKSIDININWNNFVGVMVITEDLYLDGTVVSSGSIVTTLKNSDFGVGDNNLSADSNDIIYFTVSTTTMGSGTTAADATILFDAGDIGLNNSQKKIRSFTIIEEISAPVNSDPVITLSTGSVNYTEGDPPTVIDPAAVLVDADLTDFDGGLLRVDFDITGTVNDRLAIVNEGTAAGQIGVSGTTVTYGGVVIGSFNGGTDGSDPLTVVLNINADVAAVEALIRNVTYENVSNNPSENQRQINFTVTDGDGGVSNVVSRNIVVNGLNSAPVLTGSNDLIDINEDAFNSAGTLVSILTSGWITDTDPSAASGIAVVGVDNTNGSWEFTIDGGVIWTAFVSPSENNVYLLADTPDTSIRFVPDANWNGTVSNGITFHAWDQTAGVNGDTIDMTAAANVRDEFSTNSYSANDGSVVWTSAWTEVNDDGSSSTGNIRIENNKIHIDNQDGGSLEYIYRTADLSDAVSADITFDFDAFGSGSTDIVTIGASSDGGATWTVLRQGSITGNISGTRTFNIESFTALTDNMQFRFGVVSSLDEPGEYINFDNIDIAYTGGSSGGSGSISMATASSSITVNPINDAPVGLPTITGTVTEDQTLIADVSAISDIDGLGAFSYQWLRDGSAIAGATSTTYVLDDSDVGSLISVRVDYTDGDSTAESVTSAQTAAVVNINDAPTGSVVIDNIAPAQGDTLTVSNTLADADGLSGVITYQWYSDGSAISGATGSAFITTQTQVGTVISVVASYTDDEGMAESVSSADTASVTNVNDAPVLGAIGNQSVDELVNLSFTATATDSDLPADTLTFSLDAASIALGMTIDANTGVFSWTPTEGQGGSTPSVTVTVTDSGTGNLVDSETFTITVADTNTAPVLGAIGNQSVDELVNLSFTATATDSDLPADTLTFSLDAASIALGMTIDANTGVFNWTPTEGQGGSTPSVTVTVTDNGTGNLVDSETFTITVAEINTAPVLGAIGNQSTDELVNLSFTATATDADLPADTLTFSLDAASIALGMTIDANTGVFSWTPTEGQGGLTPSVTITVTDDGTGNLVDSETFTITVADTNTAPVLGAIGNQSVDELVNLSFTATATDSDLPADTLTFSLDAASIALGMNIDANTGVFNWTPTEGQGGLIPSVTLTVTDSGTGNLVDSETFTVTVADVNVAPVLGAIGNQTTDELVNLSFTATATDSDLPADTLTFSLDAASIALGMSIDANTGVFNWTPTEGQGGATPSVTITVTDNGTGNLVDSETFTITVADVNVAPVLGAIGNQSVDELVNLSFTATATDTDLPADTLTFSLDAASLALGMSIDANTGVFNWTPTEGQGGAIPSVTVTVTDNGTGNLVDSETLTITVADTNAAPVLGAIGNQSVDELVNLSFTATATDTDLPVDTLTFSLDAASVALGMTIDANTGVFNWTPTEGQGGATPSVTITVTDNGTGNLVDSETFTITVADVNVAPVLGAIGNQSIDELVNLSFTATATDTDLPADTLTFSLDAASLALGMSIDANTGVFNSLH